MHIILVTLNIHLPGISQEIITPNHSHSCDLVTLLHHRLLSHTTVENSCASASVCWLLSFFSELILMTWRTSSLFSSWAPSTPWLDLHCGWHGFTSSSSSSAVCCTALPTCWPCKHRPGPWPTLLLRFPVCPWPCRSWWQSNHTPKKLINQKQNKSRNKGLN